MTAFWPPLGPPGLIPRGSWNAGTLYKRNDAVSYASGFYRRVETGTTPDAPDVDLVNWELLAGRGEQGEAGPAGQSAYPQKAVPENGGGSAIVDQVSQLVVPANPAVIWRELECDHALNTIYLGLDVEAELGAAKVLRPQGGSWGTTFNGDVYAIADGDDTPMLIVEI